MNLAFELGLLILFAAMVAFGAVRGRMVRRAIETGASDPKAGIDADALAQDRWVARHWAWFAFGGFALALAALGARWSGISGFGFAAGAGILIAGAGFHSRLVVAEWDRAAAEAVRRA